MLMMVERMLYRSKYSKRQIRNAMLVDSRSESQEYFFSRHAMAIKIGIHVSITILIHIFLGFAIPHKNQTPMIENTALVFFYFLCIMYLVYSAA